MNEQMGMNRAILALSEALETAVAKAAMECGKELPKGLSFELERPKHEGQGDRASSVAMQLAKPFSMPPREIAAIIAAHLGFNAVEVPSASPETSAAGGCRKMIEKVEVAGPGFINLFLAPKWFASAASDVLAQGERYGALDLGQGRKVQVEFVSANPTGPLHIGHGRGAAVGDVVARILSFTGWNVEREYYVNDAGLQIETLGRSTQARYFELCGRGDLAPFPENGYKGDYLFDLARRIREEEGDRFLSQPIEESLPWFKKYAAGVILNGIKEDLARFGVKFDNWFSEATLYEHDKVRVAMDDMKARGYAFESEGALWFRSTDFGDDKDRVLIRNNGVPTYFASDVAYHHDKFVGRGFSRVIDVWGADHHGYIPRMKAAITAIGKNPNDFDVLLIQLVNLLRDGQPVAMSTRSGEFVELSAVLDEVGVDATRFFFLTRRSDSQLDFDLDLAKKQSSDNPVYYVQYAHARISSILREWEGRGGDAAQLRDAAIPETIFENKDALDLSAHAARLLADALAEFPREVEAASRDLSPQVLTGYALSLAGIFHSFYNTNRILGDDKTSKSHGDAGEVSLGRLKLASAARNVLASCLRLLGVSAPERM